jgi:hypothetical protein
MDSSLLSLYNTTSAYVENTGLSGRKVLEDISCPAVLCKAFSQANCERADDFIATERRSFQQ